MTTATTISTSTTTATAPSNKGMHIGLWVTQALLAASFAMFGATKLSAPIEALQAQMPWVSGTMGGAVRFIGAVELAGALGLILPSATRIAPKLTPLAAMGLATVMLLASITHISRGEFGMIAFNAVLGGMALFIAWGRAKKAPIGGR